MELSDPAAERAVLSGVMAGGPDAFVDVCDLVTPNTFTVGANQVIWRCVQKSLEDREVADLPNVLSAAHSLGLDTFFADPDEKKHLAAVARFQTAPGTVRALAAKIRKLEVTRAARVVLAEADQSLGRVTGDESVQAILGLLETPVLNFSSSLAGTDESEPKPLDDGLVAWVEHLAANPVDQVGLPTGFRELDHCIGGGMRPGGITLVCARSGVGKSHLGIKVSTNLAAGSAYQWPEFDVAPRVPVLYLDTEMGEAEHRLRRLAGLSGVPFGTIERGLFARDAQQLEAVRAAADRLSSASYDFRSIAGQPFEDTLSMMRRWVIRKVGLGADGKANPCCIVFDYVKLMDAAAIRNLQEYQYLGLLMSGLHNFTARWRVPILAFAQMNRKGIDDDGEDAVAGGDRLLWLASNLVFWRAQSDDELSVQSGGAEGRYTHKFVVRKARHGPGHRRDDFIHVRADLGLSRFHEGPLNSRLDGFGGGDAGKF